MRFTTRICTFLIATVAISGQASSQSMQLEYSVPNLVVESPAEKPFTLWERFEYAFGPSAEKVYTDRLHSLNTTHWYLEMAGRNADEFRDHTTHVASRAFSRSIVVSLREAAFDLPVMEWLKDQRGFLADFVRNAVATEGEEAVSPLDPSYRVLERSWWKRMSDSRGFRYGFRPFRTSPYAFVSAGLWNGDSLLVLAHVRYHYKNFADHQFEFALSVPLAHGFSIDVGTAYEFGRHEDTQRMVLKLSKQLEGGGIVHIGLEAQEHPTFLVGISLPL